MFEFDSVQDFVCKSLIGKVLVKVDDVELLETIVRAHHDSSTNSIIVESETSQIYIYNSSFVIVDNLVEVDWGNYSLQVEPKFGISSWLSKSEKNEDYGDVFSTDAFFEHVESGMFIDSDGHGYPSNGTHHIFTCLSVRDLAACKYSKTVSHIIWYNK